MDTAAIIFLIFLGFVLYVSLGAAATLCTPVQRLLAPYEGLSDEATDVAELIAVVLWPVLAAMGLLWLAWHSRRLPGLLWRAVSYLGVGVAHIWRHHRRPKLPRARVRR